MSKIIKLTKDTKVGKDECINLINDFRMNVIGHERIKLTDEEWNDFADWIKIEIGEPIIPESETESINVKSVLREIYKEYLEYLLTLES